MRQKTLGADSPGPPKGGVAFRLDLLHTGDKPAARNEAYHEEHDAQDQDQAEKERGSGEDQANVLLVEVAERRSAPGSAAVVIACPLETTAAATAKRGQKAQYP